MALSYKNLIKGIYYPPGDKSISHRALILTSQAVGKSKITNLLEGQDVINTLKVMRILGAKIFKKNKEYVVYGVPPGMLFQPTKTLDFGNSGTGVRLLMGLIASNKITARITGDRSLSKRPMKRVTTHLEKTGALIKMKKQSYLPITIQGVGDSIPLKYKALL